MRSPLSLLVLGVDTNNATHNRTFAVSAKNQTTIFAHATNGGANFHRNK
jgi:hypothetical protein